MPPGTERPIERVAPASTTFDLAAAPLPSRAARDRVREQQRKLLLAGGLLFAGYYALFFALAIYTLGSLVVGLAMSAGLALSGWALPTFAGRSIRPVAVFVAVLLAVGANTSALLSDGSHCVGFHTIWALPLIYGLFIQDDAVGSATIASLSLLGGLSIFVSEGETASRTAQWLTLSVSAGIFGFVQQALLRRHLEQTLSEHEQAQARLVVADRMASVGMLAAGVAHEINNPMMYVTSNLELLAEHSQAQRFVEPEVRREAEEAIRDALAGCARVTALVKTLTRMSRSEGGVVGEVDLNRAIGDVLQLSRRDLERHVTLDFAAGEVPHIAGDEARLGQVFLNLLVNAAQAVASKPDGQRTIAVRTSIRSPREVVVEVRDTGCGIPEAAQKRIFEPFYTTKASGEGTGLGLSVCADIVAQHGGSIEVESVLDQGTVFRVVLPTTVPGAPLG